MAVAVTRKQSSLSGSDQPGQGAAEGEVVAGPVADEVIDAVVDELNELVRRSGIDAALAIGGIVIGKVYNGDIEAWRSHGAKETSFRRLARHCKDVEGGDGRLQMSAASLYRSVAITVMVQQLGVSSWKHLGVSHLRAVLGLPLETQRKLLAAAEGKAMTAEELERRVARQRKTEGGRRGRRALPAFVKSIGALGRLLEQAEGEEDPFGDLDQVDELSAAQAEALLRTVTEVKLKCEELQTRLAAKVSGSGAPAAP